MAKKPHDLTPAPAARRSKPAAQAGKSAPKAGPAAKASPTALAKTAKAHAEIQALMSEIAGIIILDYFFDPEREDEYKSVVRELKKTRQPETPLHVMQAETTAGDIVVSLLALGERSAFRVVVVAHAFEVAISGVWNFDEETMADPHTQVFRGAPNAVAKGLDELADVMADGLLSEEELENLMDLAGDSGDAEEAAEELPPPTPEDRRHIHAMARRVAKRTLPDLSEKDQDWLEDTPQSLPVILECFIEAGSKPGVSFEDTAIIAYLVLLSAQLELVRYRHDEGRTWATNLLGNVQERMVTAAETEEIPQEGWMLLAMALTQSRIPITDEMRTRLASVGLSRNVDEAPQDLGSALAETLDSIASAAETPFQVLESLQGAAAVMPPEMRCFIATEMAMSPHAVLRDVAPLLLLDPETTVRRHVAQGLPQVARPDTMSGATLRRLIGVRNWLPPADRPELDAAIRSARLAGVQPDIWPKPPPSLEVYASFVDGSSAQSVVFVDRNRKTGSIGGILLRHGTGINDTWLHQDMPGSEVAGIMKTVLGEMGGMRVDRAYADMVIQHAIATGLMVGNVPPFGLLGIADFVGAHDWQDRRLDIAAEVNAEWDSLPAADRMEEKAAKLQDRAAQWMEAVPIFKSWHERGPAIEKRYRDLAPMQAAAQLLKAELKDHRMAWAEKFLLVALCCKASPDPSYRPHVAEFVAVARALTGRGPLSAIPAMHQIAGGTAIAIAYRSW